MDSCHRLRQALGTAGSAFASALPTSSLDGGTVIGWHLRRSLTGPSGMFLTSLQTYIGSTAPTVPTVDSSVSHARGLQTQLQSGMTATHVDVVFRDPGTTSGVTVGSVGVTVNGDVGGVIRSGTGSNDWTGSRLGVFLGNGTLLKDGSVDAITATQAATVGALFNGDHMWGDVKIAGSGTTTVKIYPPSTLSTPVAMSASSSAVTANYTNGGSGTYYVQLQSSGPVDYHFEVAFNGAPVTLATHAMCE